MQDNLEFLQWSKRYWDQYFPGGDYDALARRKGSGGPVGATTSARTSTGGAGAGAARRGTTPTTASATRRAPAAGGGSSAVLQSENTQLKQTVEGLERERDFYFSKLRDIELLVQQAVEQDPEVEKDENGLVKLIQAILYSTEEGFEIPAEAEGVVGGEEETF
jgi:RP/EB family microtubule-associated protein